MSRRHRHGGAAGSVPRGASLTRNGIPAPLFYGLSGLLMLTNALAVAAFLMSPDIARLMSGQNEEILAAYEERITQLRIEVDRLYSRSYAQAGDLNLQLQELSQQQEMLAEQHEVVKALVTKANELGIEAAALPTSGENAAMETSSLYMPATGNPDIDAVARSLGNMISDSRTAMTTISQAAAGRTESILAEFDALGIPVDLPTEPLAGIGGPLLPPVGEDAASGLVDDANAVLAALYRYQAAKGIIARAPVHMPIAGAFRQSSTFGNRKDPFTGRLAFHAGLDFAAASGTAVLSAGEGTVSSAGRQAGYGNVVEITHGDGLVTRYAHLSAILVSEGQQVLTGTPIARVGSTGRSTGPHLHFEVRRAGAPLDPKLFLDSGRRLQHMI